MNVFTTCSNDKKTGFPLFLILVRVFLGLCCFKGFSKTYLSEQEVPNSEIVFKNSINLLIRSPIFWILLATREIA